MKTTTTLLKSLPIMAFSCSTAFGTVAAPYFTNPGGTFPTGGGTLIGCVTPGATIRYTMNGQEPDLNDPIVPVTGVVFFADNIVLKAKAWVGVDVSPTTSGTYTFTGDIAAGRLHSTLLDAAGNGYAWGAQNDGRLANLNTAAGTAIALMAYYPSTITVKEAFSISPGQDHSIMVDDQGLVFGTGNNSNGQVGDSSTTTRSGMVAVHTGTPATIGNVLGGCLQVSAGNDFSGALATSGGVWTWGIETGGRLGNGNTGGNRTYAVPVVRGDIPGDPALGGIAEIEFGGGFGMARENGPTEVPAGLGGVWTWGHNGDGQLGQGHTTNRARAYPVMLNSTTELTDATSISGGQSHAAVVRWKTGDPALQGSVWSFGQRGSGRLGNNSTASGAISYPVQAVVSGGTALSNIVSVSAGAAHTLALEQGTGQVWSWGYNGKGELGDGTTVNKGYAVKVKGVGGVGDLAGIAVIAAGGSGSEGFSLAIGNNGKVYVWGSNTNAQLSYAATNAAQSLPVEVPVWTPRAEASVVTATPTVTTGTAPGAATVAVGRVMAPQDGSGVKFELWVNGVLHTSRTPVIPADWNVSLSALAAGSYTVVAVLTDSHNNVVLSDQDSFTIN